jgi:hypothetical protein
VARIGARYGRRACLIAVLGGGLLDEADVPDRYATAVDLAIVSPRCFGGAPPVYQLCGRPWQLLWD